MFAKVLGKLNGGEMYLLATFLVQAIHVTVALLLCCLLCCLLCSPSYTWLFTRAKIMCPTVCVVRFLALCFRDCNRGLDRKRGNESQDMYYCTVYCKILPAHPSFKTLKVSVSALLVTQGKITVRHILGGFTSIF